LPNDGISMSIPDLPEQIPLVRDILDNRLLDRDQQPMGRADGVVVLVGPGEPPRVAMIECGAAVLADRLHPRLGRLVRRMAGHLSPRRGRIVRIPWSKVRSLGLDLHLSVRADDTPALDWEHFLQNHVTSHLPYGKNG
jgi:hypothetical protein